MPTDAEQLARLRVARASGILPADLADWLIDRVTVPRTVRRRAVAALLREAAALVPGSRWAKVRALRTQIEAFRSVPAVFARYDGGDDTVPGLVLLALRIAPDCPNSTRQLLRILDGADD